MKKLIIILLSVLFAATSTSADDHTHFDTEKVKSGVQFYRAWRTQEQIDDDWWTYDMAVPPGDDNAAWYDVTLDGALTPIRNVDGDDITLGTLQPFYREEGGQPSVSTSGAVWIQFDKIFDQDFYDNVVSQSNFDSMKWFRYYQQKGQCGTEDRFLTLTWLGGDDDAVEVAVSGGCYDWPDQGIDTNYTIPGDTWTRITVVFDIAGQKVDIYATNISTGVTNNFFTRATPFPSPFNVFDLKMQLQSTSRNHNPGSTPYDYYSGVRNLIVSTDPIAFTTSGSGDTTPPSVSITTSDPSDITSDSLAVAGTSSDAVGVSICKWRVGTAPDDSNGTTLTGTTSFSGTTSGYSLGQNALYVGCKDAADNWGSDSIIVNYQGTTSSDSYFDTGLSDTNVASATPDCSTYDPTDGSCGDGSDRGFATVADANAIALAPGAVLYFNKGDDWTSEAIALDIAYSGTETNPIVVDAFGTGDNPILYDLTVTANRVNVSNIVIDHQKATNTCVELDGSYITLDGMEIKNGTRDGIDVTGSNITIQNSSIHHFLNGYYGRDPILDAHLIALREVNTVTIDNCTLHTFSGDAVQADPTYGDTNNITITNNHFYSESLSEDFNGTCPSGDGWCSGDNGGENFIDTKADTDVRTKWTITGNIFHGLVDIPVIPNNRAALNLKHNTDITVSRNKIYDNEIGIRMRGDDDVNIGNPEITLTNNILYDNGRVFWVGDGDGSTGTTYDEPENLLIYNNTIGDGNITVYDEDDQTQFSGWDLRNNAFLGTKPARFSDSSNISADAGDFTDTGTDDYTVAEGSDLIAAGDDIAAVTVDYTGASRSGTMEAGAYAYGDVGQPGQNGFTGVSAPAGGILFNAN